MLSLPAMSQHDPGHDGDGSNDSQDSDDGAAGPGEASAAAEDEAEPEAGADERAQSLRCHRGTMSCRVRPLRSARNGDDSTQDHRHA